MFNKHEITDTIPDRTERTLENPDSATSFKAEYKNQEQAERLVFAVEDFKRERNMQEQNL